MERGASAQEECICRCSTLFFDLTFVDAMNQFYRAHRGKLTPLYNDDCIYTPEVKGKSILASRKSG
ncbi:PARG family protein [Lachnospiraceae bacterium ZAX-1]